MKGSKLYIHHYIPSTRTEGPGNRFTLWLQGCSIRCKGCMARHTWNREEGEQISIKKLLEEIKNTPDIEGITILGGEPLDQATALLTLLKEIRATHLNVLLFTGYETEKLSDPEQLEILSLCDIIIDGPYREELKDLSRPLIGSSNQRLRFVSNRYTEADWEQLPRQIEVRVNKEGNITINGMWDKEWMEKFLKDL